LREARAKLAELRVDYAEENPRIQEALARIKNLEQSNGGITVSTLNEQPPVCRRNISASGAYDVAPGERKSRAVQQRNGQRLVDLVSHCGKFHAGIYRQAALRGRCADCVAKVKLETRPDLRLLAEFGKIFSTSGQRRPSGDPVFADFPNETKIKRQEPMKTKALIIIIAAALMAAGAEQPRAGH